MQIGLFILAVVLFIGLVLAHEWGHFVVARRNGVEAEEFGLGLPPRAKGKRLKSGLLLSLNWLPLGGFVKLKGEHDSDTEKGSFGAASLGAKTRILLAGVGINALIGLVLLTILAFVGMPVLITKEYNNQEQFTVKSDTRITHQYIEAGNVLPGSPAAKSGIKGNDKIDEIAYYDDLRVIHTAVQLRSATSDFAGKLVNIGITHPNGGQEAKTVQLLSKNEVSASHGQKGYLGVQPNQLTIQRSTWSAPVVAVGLTGQLTILTFEGLGHALGGLGSIIAGTATGNHEARINGQAQAESQVGGPAAIIKILWNSGSLGVNFMVGFIAVISLSLALINILPIPVFDGGRLAMIAVSRGIWKRPLSKDAEEKIIGLGMLLIILLVILITISDVKRFY